MILHTYRNLPMIRRKVILEISQMLTGIRKTGQNATFCDDSDRIICGGK